MPDTIDLLDLKQRFVAPAQPRLVAPAQPRLAEEDDDEDYGEDDEDLGELEDDDGFGTGLDDPYEDDPSELDDEDY